MSLAPGAGACLVDDVLDLPELHNRPRLETAALLGATETLHRLRERPADVAAYPAMTTVLLKATVGRGRKCPVSAQAT
jgi:hypothetical protein